MRLAVIIIPLFVLVSTSSPANGGEELRWIAFVRAPPGESTGSLEVVRSNGRGRRTLIEDGVSEADVGRAGAVLAIRHREGSPRDLLRVAIQRSSTASLDAGPADLLLAGLAASPLGDIAYQRLVSRSIEVPEHLRRTPRHLAPVRLPVLVPPGRPFGTTDTVVETARRFYRVLFTNDPGRELAHAEQINRFVLATRNPRPPPLLPVTVPVRGTEGAFSCGASACFLDWEERGVSYSVGEFGSPEEAADFAESLVLIDELLGPTWRTGLELRVPELVVKAPAGGERVLESEEEYCECGFRPVGWGPEGDRLLVVAAADTSTSLEEYTLDGDPPGTLLEGDRDSLILDAAYGPRGVIVLLGGEGGGPGALREIGGQDLVADVVAFDVAGSTLAYVGADGRVVVRDLESGLERSIGDGAIDVSVGQDLLPGPPPSPSPAAAPPPSEGFPALLAAGLVAAVIALLAGLVLVRRGRSRR